MFLVPDDLAPFADIDQPKAAAMIEDAEAQASIVAPCLTTPEFAAEPSLVAAARSILRGAVLRWDESGSGALQQVQSGPFGATMDTRQQRRGMFWPSEIQQLQGLCARLSGESAQRSLSSLRPSGATASHMPWCAMAFGATYCSCGSDLTNYEYPLYEGGALTGDGGGDP